jgi:hypothetical protein
VKSRPALLRLSKRHTTPGADAYLHRGSVRGRLGALAKQARLPRGAGRTTTKPILVAPPAPRLCTPHVDFIAETLARYPKLRATRLFEMLKEPSYLRDHAA